MERKKNTTQIYGRNMANYKVSVKSGKKQKQILNRNLSVKIDSHIEMGRER